MKTAEELAKKFFLDYPSVYESRLLDEQSVVCWFRRAQSDALRWAADDVGENLRRGNMSFCDLRLREKADAIERGDKPEGGMGKHKTRSRDQRIQAVLMLRGTECKCYFPKRKRRTKK